MKAQADREDARAANDNSHSHTSRRQFLRRIPTTAAAGTLAWQWTSSSLSRADAPAVEDPIAKLLKPYVLKRDTVDRFLDPDARVWARFHPTYGYLLRNSFMRDGAFATRTLGRYEPTGQRRQVNFRNEPCRINTYGNSFTQGHQVSDGETWQEVLAAHFCEPIRNFGIGGFGVYQAYRRLLEVEQTDMAAPYLVFNIWGDDHHRSINAWRWLTFPPEVVESMSGDMFHANPWDHARLDSEGRLREVANPCPTHESLYRLCDAEFVYETFKDDEIVHALLAIRTGRVANGELLRRMAAASDYSDLDLESPDAVKRTTRGLYEHYAIVVGKRIFESLQAFATAHEKKLLVLLSHPEGSVWHYCAGKPADNPHHVEWHPQIFKECLQAQGVPFLDTVEKHVDDFATFRGTPAEYVKKYYIGHYNPTGNHFFAFAIRDAVVSWLDPAPPSYRDSEADQQIRFDGYLPN